MSESEEDEQKKIKEIKISNKGVFVSAKKSCQNGINIIPIKIALTPKINHSITKNFNSTSSNRLYQKILDEENKKKKEDNKILIMTPRVKTNYSNNSSSIKTPNVIIKNINYNNVYNINIEKKTPNKIYKNYTYSKPKTTSNINIKSGTDSNLKTNIINYNTLKKEKEKKSYYLRFNSEKNIFMSNKNDNNKKQIIINTEIKNIGFPLNNQIKTLNYNNLKNSTNKTKNNKYANKTLQNSLIKSLEITLDNNYPSSFNPSEINILFEKINSIIISLSKNRIRNIHINCQEFFDFYNKSSLKKLFPSFFKDNDKLILNSSINLILFSLIVIYNLSSENLFSYNIMNVIERILLHCKNNFALFAKQIQIKSKINFEDIFKKCLINQNIINIINEQDLVNEIYLNSKAMTNEIKLILNYYKTINTKFYNNMIEKFNNISVQTEEDILNYFFYNIYMNDNKIINNNNLKAFSPRKKNIFENISIKKDFINNNNGNKLIIKKLVKRQKKEMMKNKIEIPYIKTPLMKKYTLILDLDKTLCYKNDNTGEIILRNGLFSFLSSIKPFYELVSFSLESKNINDYILYMIEQDKKYFDYNFYKEHSILYENNLVKDISLIGRDISKIIIVDDDEICFKLNKENGIKISPFNGENNNDNKLFELKKILKEIYIKNYEDVRVAIKDNKFDILNKITFN